MPGHGDIMRHVAPESELADTLIENEPVFEPSGQPRTDTNEHDRKYVLPLSFVVMSKFLIN